MESLKITSRVTTIGVTIIIAILTYISTMNPDNLATQLGVYGSFAPLIIVIACAIVNHYSEEKRVTRAEELIENNYTKLGYPKTQEENKEPTIKVEVDADKVLSEIEKRQKETQNTTPTVDDMDQALTEIREEEDEETESNDDTDVDTQ